MWFCTGEGGLAGRQMGCTRIEHSSRVVGQGGGEEDGELALRQAGSLLHPTFAGREIVMWGCSTAA